MAVILILEDTVIFGLNGLPARLHIKPITWSKGTKLVFRKEEYNDLPFLLLKFLLSTISAVWYSCLSFPRSLLRTLVDYFSEISSQFWRNSHRALETLENLQMYFRLLYRIWVSRLFLKWKILQLYGSKESSRRQYDYFVCL